MKKPIAILKDSLREAWDSKTLLVMLILAAVFLVGVASIGYTAAAPKTVVETFAADHSRQTVRLQRGKLPVDLREQEGGRSFPYPKITVTTFKTLKEGGHESTGEHEFTLLVQDVDPAAKKDGGAAKEADKDKAADPKGIGGSAGSVFERYVAVWHDSGGDKVLLDEKKDLDPRKWILVAPVTDDMVREYLAVELERVSQLPTTKFERLPDPNPGERVYKITTGPSPEPRLWPVRISIGFGAWQSEAAIPLGIALYTIQDILISSVGGLIILLIAVIITSFFIPNMLRPGSVVMLLSKPINRITLLLFKYLGGLFFVLILTSFVVGGVWLITGVRAGVWAPGVFLIIPLMTLTFAILYAVSTLTAVWSRNSIVSILVTLAFAGLLWLVGKVEVAARVFRTVEDVQASLRKEEPKYQGWTDVAIAVNNVLPRWHDIDRLGGEAVADSLMTPAQQEAQGTAAEKKHLPSWGGTLGVTAVWIFALLGLASWRFSVKDF
jgi:ABC-type transport system involved in multi-copper enzyme maturation permease subunit